MITHSAVPTAFYEDEEWYITDRLNTLNLNYKNLGVDSF